MIASASFKVGICTTNLEIRDSQSHRLLHDASTVQFVIECIDSCRGNDRDRLTILGGMYFAHRSWIGVNRVTRLAFPVFVHIRSLPRLHGLGNASRPRIVLCVNLCLKLRYTGMCAGNSNAGLQFVQLGMDRCHDRCRTSSSCKASCSASAAECYTCP